MQEIRVRIPQLENIGEAILLYYSKTELSTKDMKKLFGDKAESTIYKLKKIVRSEMDAQGVEVFDNKKINTKIAFKTWGFDIDDLENRFKKIKKIESQISNKQ